MPARRGRALERFAAKVGGDGGGGGIGGQPVDASRLQTGTAERWAWGKSAT